MNESFKEVIGLVKEIIARFESIEGRRWGAEGAMIELQKQVGELAKLILMQEGYYFADRDKLNEKYISNKERIGDELADIFYALIRIAKHYDIDLVDANRKAREEEDKFLKSKEV